MFRSGSASFTRFRLIARTVLRRGFPPQGWDTEMVEDSERSYAFNMRSCFCLDVLSARGAPELTHFYCQMDELFYEELQRPSFGSGPRYWPGAMIAVTSVGRCKARRPKGDNHEDLGLWRWPAPRL